MLDILTSTGNIHIYTLLLLLLIFFNFFYYYYFLFFIYFLFYLFIFSFFFYFLFFYRPFSKVLSHLFVLYFLSLRLNNPCTLDCNGPNTPHHINLTALYILTSSGNIYIYILLLLFFFFSYLFIYLFIYLLYIYFFYLIFIKDTFPKYCHTCLFYFF